jgi:APA family basic amino acid/polyamine antiporter
MTDGTATSDPGFAAQPARHVTVAYLVMVAVAMVVGAGIFKSPSIVASGTGSFWWLIAAWTAGGLISMAGALCYAELATTFPNAGGDYHFLKRAYGNNLAFLFAWSRFAVINTGSLALLGFVLGDYANAVVTLGANGPAIYAFVSVALLTFFNLKSMYSNATADFALTGLEVAGVLIMVAAGLVLVVTGTPPLTIDGPAPADGPPSFGLALVFVLLAFGGWSEIATMSSEVKDSRRGMVKALVWSIIAITALFIAVNWAFWRGLGIEGLSNSAAPAADLMNRAFGSAAGIITAIAIALATITSINATIVVGARTTYAAARDFPGLARIGRWDADRGIPARAILAQSAVALLLVLYGAASYDGFQALVDYTAPVFWLFMGLSGISVIVLRFRYPDAPRPFRTPLYPLLPLIFAATAGFMMWSSLDYVSATYGRFGALMGLAVLAAGAMVLAIMRFARPRS